MSHSSSTVKLAALGLLATTVSCGAPPILDTTSPNSPFNITNVQRACLNVNPTAQQLHVCSALMEVQNQFAISSIVQHDEYLKRNAILLSLANGLVDALWDAPYYLPLPPIAPPIAPPPMRGPKTWLPK